MEGGWFSDVDPENERELTEAIENLTKQKTIITWPI